MGFVVSLLHKVLTCILMLFGEIMDSESYLSSFEILSNDFRRITEFVEPVDANLSTYSHRLYELLLRACTDFESVCKERLVVDGCKKSPRDMKIYDYRVLEATLFLERVEVGVLVWRPNVDYVRPFIDWSSASPPLQWYSNYNKVKHNRNTSFSLASLENVRLALSGLFALLARLGVLSTNKFGYQERHYNGFKESLYPGQIFSLRVPV
jgi:hypothetical protein